MLQSIGPFDGRKPRKKRCDRCVERRIKCVGGRPCMNCIKTSHKCHTTVKQQPPAWVFVHKTPSETSRIKSVQRKAAEVPLHGLPSSARSDTYLKYFFTSFLSQNAFTSVTGDFRTALSTLIHHSSGLHDAINAISALHIAQSSVLQITEDYPAALHAYARSVQSLQTTITSGSVVHDPSALWTTLLLGLFELMRDPTGTNWLAHFLHGTSTMLRLQGPGMLAHSGRGNEHRQAFFVSARIFEISRALIYTEPTFLAAPDWVAAIDMYWAQHPSAWSPKEALFDMLPQFVDLAMRTLRFVTDDEDISQQKLQNTAQALAQEGLVLESALSAWVSTLSSWGTGNADADSFNAELRIALVYYYTISIYLDGIFSYHTPFTIPSAPTFPILTRGVIEGYVESILTLSQEILAQGCAGILLFFPLRVAGARAHGVGTRARVLQILQLIMRRGFTVAQAFVDDLNNLWGLNLAN